MAGKKKKKARHRPGADWASLSRERLLDLRICDLDLRIEGTELERHLGTLYAELALHGFVFRPHCWLSDEWFSPDGTPVSRFRSISRTRASSAWSGT